MIMGAGARQTSHPAQPILIVAYDAATDRYFLQDQHTKRRVAGPFPSSWAALEHARTLAAVRRWKS
jgi:hypothetical protein